LNRHTRRRFLKDIAALGGAMAIGPWKAWAEEEPGPRALPDNNPTLPDMTIARLESPPTAETDIKSAATSLTEEAITAIGGMGRFVSKGDIVWVKPNMGWNRAPELAACTNPDVVATLVRLCLEAGAKTVKVGDNPCHEARQTYRSSGIEAAARAAGAEVVYLDSRRFKEVELGGHRLKKWELYPDIIESDLVINVPIVKHHSLSKATLCMKNYMGIIGGQRNAWHQALSDCLVDITTFMKPRLCVLDAVRILTAHGPQGGKVADVKLAGIVAAGTDIVALDTLGIELMDEAPQDNRMVRAAQEAGLGEIDYRNNLTLKELLVS
jgi:uncharacterized protein (DUF362 family)